MSVVERKKREKQQRRETILEAAEKLFSKNGIEGTSMSSIAEEAELSKGAVYLYFRKKESLVYQLLIYYLSNMKRSILQAAERGESGYEKSRRVLEAFSAYYHEQELFLSLSRYLDYKMNSSKEESEEEIDEAEQCLAVIAELKEKAVELIREGQADGSIRPDTDPALTAATIVHVVESSLLKFGGTLQKTSKKREYESKDLVDHLLELVLHSLKNHNHQGEQ